jgi:hypothetical protein
VLPVASLREYRFHSSKDQNTLQRHDRYRHFGRSNPELFGFVLRQRSDGENCGLLKGGSAGQSISCTRLRDLCDDTALRTCCSARINLHKARVSYPLERDSDQRRSKP